MVCIELKQNLDQKCALARNKFLQSVVLVNKNDLEDYVIITPSYIHEYDCNYSVSFKLKEGKTGYLYSFNGIGNNVTGSFSKKEQNNFSIYEHSVQIPLVGITEEINCVLEQLEEAEYFAALQFDNKIVIYGFEFGLRLPSYEYSGFGDLLELKSEIEELKPLLYYSGGEEITDFENLFSNNKIIKKGEFNKDYNKDYTNG